jgi:superfamily II DNA/RNA helicase
MLDMGFIPDIEFICSKLPETRQTMLFSATMPPPIEKLASKFLNNPKRIEVSRAASTNENITAFKIPVKSRQKRDTLEWLLANDEVETAIIFSNRKTTVRELNKHLQKRGFASGEIHGDMDQSSRLAELDRFKAGEVNILVASDVAARGLDIKGVSHVFNFDTPWHPDDYVHRVGRTGRAGAKGRAFTFVSEDDAEAIENVEKLTGAKIKVFGKEDVRVPLVEPGSDQEKGRGKAEDKPKRQSRRNEDDQDAPEKPKRERKPRKERSGDRADSKPRSRRRDEDDEPVPAGEWNGPRPSFLDVGFG